MKKKVKSKLIFLNGASNSGKSTIAKELQNILVEPYLHIGIDSFMKMMPEKYLGSDETAKEGFHWKSIQQDSGDERIQICAGPYGKRVVSGMGYAIASLLKKGLNVILDEVCYGSDQLQFYINLFQGHHAFYVGVFCPLQVILEREKKVAEKLVSTAASEIELVHQGITYDKEVDTSIMTPLECAEEVLESYQVYLKKIEQEESLKAG